MKDSYPRLSYQIPQLSYTPVPFFTNFTFFTLRTKPIFNLSFNSIYITGFRFSWKLQNR